MFQNLQGAFFPEPVVTQMVQNFFNFFNPAMFWLTFLPFFHRLGPIFAANATTSSPETFRSADVPDFNVANIYFDTFSPDGIADQVRVLDLTSQMSAAL